ncbi:hypothetical protein [Methylobacterium soli]|uniref:Intracellular septation protein A n=1 Tax=Methylobacterium soli TaxID=553447 RepID=A0A6L3SPE5_9HYPH|nr:hypothetical protein [Methylobacterium soli]KAB1071231.1 hypothetical protein F6X53_29145 [Methylobacterium soli]GJE41223.1 hypothetical protein AEGHOMDF_0385 [Methylobacterium soli]
MNLFASFAPFLVFAVLIHLGFVEGGLWAGALTAGVLLLRDRLLLGRSLKILEVGTMALFAGLALYTAATTYLWTIPTVRLIVDAGLLAIVLSSLAVGQPFTLQYARESAPAEVWSEPAFLAVNRRITLAWAAAFVVLVVADAAMVFLPEIPRRLDIIATVLALVGAYKFTVHASEQQSKAV